jgi:hypothetical protein
MQGKLYLGSPEVFSACFGATQKCGNARVTPWGKRGGSVPASVVQYIASLEECEVVVGVGCESYVGDTGYLVAASDVTKDAILCEFASTIDALDVSIDVVWDK